MKEYYLIEFKVNNILYKNRECNLCYSGSIFSKDINKRKKYLVKLIKYIINFIKMNDDRIINYSIQEIMNENQVQFFRALHADSEDRSNRTFRLVWDIVQKLHLY
jgi:hypothetical protein